MMRGLQPMRGALCQTRNPPGRRSVQGAARHHSSIPLVGYMHGREDSGVSSVLPSCGIGLGRSARVEPAMAMQSVVHLYTHT